MRQIDIPERVRHAVTGETGLVIDVRGGDMLVLWDDGRKRWHPLASLWHILDADDSDQRLAARATRMPP